eukprot:5097929-Prymnesium_polylepis.1
MRRHVGCRAGSLHRVTWRSQVGDERRAPPPYRGSRACRARASREHPTAVTRARGPSGGVIGSSRAPQGSESRRRVDPASVCEPGTAHRVEIPAACGSSKRV